MGPIVKDSSEALFQISDVCSVLFVGQEGGRSDKEVRRLLTQHSFPACCQIIIHSLEDTV
jgi:hypothetical protein